jgi:hypothetical protein
MAQFSLPENLKVVMGYPPAIGTAGAMMSDYISVKNLHRLYIVVSIYQNDGTEITIAPYRATAVAPTGDVVLAAGMVQRIWSNLDNATSDLLVERTAAINYACGTGSTNKLIIFEIDPATLGDNGATPPVPYDVVSVRLNPPAATSTVSVTFFGVPRYPGRVLTAPSIIID